MLLSTTGILFTDDRATVLFADHTLLRWMEYADAGEIIGEPVSAFLGLDFHHIDELLKEIRTSGQIENWELPLRTRTNEVLVMHCWAVANIDYQGNFIGADLTLQPALTVMPVQVAAPTLDMQIVAVQAASHQDTNRENGLRLLTPYFKDVMAALQTLVSRMMGKRYAELFDTQINETASRNQWPVRMEPGRCQLESGNLTLDVYRALLAKGVTYATRMVGKGMIASQIQQIDKETSADVLQLAEQLNLSKLV